MSPMGVPSPMGGIANMAMPGMAQGGMMGVPMPFDSRRTPDGRGDHSNDGEYYDAQRDARGPSGTRGYSQKSARSSSERERPKDRRQQQPYYYAQASGGDGLSAGLSAMNLGGANLTQNLTQGSSNGPLTQASSTLSQPMSQPDRVSLSALSQESYQGDDFYKSQSFVDPYM